MPDSKQERPQKSTNVEQQSKIGSPKSQKMLDFKLMKRLLPYVQHHTILLGLSLFFMLGLNVSGVLHPYLIKIGIDQHVATGNLEGLYSTCLILGIVLFGNFLFFVAFNYSVNYLGQRLLFDLRLDLFQKVLALSNNYFDVTAVGKTLTNVTNDVEAIRQFISEGIVNVAGDILKMLFILIAMLLVNYRLALLAFTTIPIFLLATVAFRKSIRGGYRGVRKANAEINTSLVETINGIKEIHLFNHEEHSEQTFDGFNRHYLNAFLKVVHSYALYFPVIEIVANAGMVLIFLYTHFVLGDRVQVGVIFAFFSYITMFFKPLRQMAEKFNMFQSAMAASERVFTLLDEQIVIRNPEQPKRIAGPMQGKIRFDNVTFAYTPGTPVMKNVSFTIQPGEKVAIVGHHRQRKNHHD